MNEKIKQVIEEWQEENKEKRAIIVLAVEEVERTEESHQTRCEAAFMGKQHLLVDAFKANLSDSNSPFGKFLKIAQLDLLISKISEK